MIKTATIGKQVKLFWLWLLRKDVLIFLLFVGLVSIFWWGRTMSSPRDVDLRVSLAYTGISEQVVFENELPESMKIIVRDNGQQLRKIRHQDLNLTINLSPYLSEEIGSLALTADVLRSRLQDILPGSTSIQQINPELIASAYYVQQQKTVPVVVQSLVSAAPQHQLLGEPHVTPSSVRVFGSREAIEQIDHVLTDSIRMTDLREEVIREVALQLPAGVRVSPTTVQVAWKAEPFTEKSFTLPVEVLGVPEGTRVRLFPQQVGVTVRVGVSHFAHVQESDLKAVCYYPSKPIKSLPIELITANPYISNIRISPSSVEYMIQF